MNSIRNLLFLENEETNDGPNRAFLYSLWLFFGLFGFHHVYLGRIEHAIVTCFTLNFFFIGWIKDLFNLERYILSSMKKRTYYNKKIPKFKFKIFIYQILFSLYFIILFHFLFPSSSNIIKLFKTQWKLTPKHVLLIAEIAKLFYQIGIIIFSVIGINLISSTFDIEGPFYKLMFLDFFIFVLYNIYKNYEMTGNCHILSYSIVAINVIIFSIKRKKKYISWTTRRNIFVRFAIFFLLASLLLIVNMFVILNNVKVKQGNKEKILFEVLKEFIKSREFLLVKRILREKMKEFFVLFKGKGFVGTFKYFSDSLSGKDKLRKSLKILEIKNDESNIKEVKKAYKKLIMKWHPDKNLGNEDYCEEKMEEINEAYMFLSNYYSK